MISNEDEVLTLSEYVDLLNEFGPHSKEERQFRVAHNSNNHFSPLFKTALALKICFQDEKLVKEMKEKYPLLNIE